MQLAEKLEDWYSDNLRDLPWRKTTDPYKIWLSEIILQQTRIEQGMAYYRHFVETYPTVDDLAAASEEQVMKSWQGLGYYSRARNLHASAKYIAEELGGVFPSTHEGILKLKGVGRYTAAAIASFAFGLPHPVIDGNVYRVISRLYGIATPIGTDAAYTEFEKLLLNLIDKKNPHLFNQAMMDFGSTYCKPLNPDCENCIFAKECVAHQGGKVDLFPVKPDKVKVTTRHFYYFDILTTREGEAKAYVRCREGKDIWRGLYELPLVESERKLSDKEAIALGKEFGGSDAEVRIVQQMTHKLTHRTIEATFVEVKTDAPSSQKLEKYREISREELKKLPVSRLIDRYLTKL